MDTKQRDSAYIAATYGRFDVVLENGCGSQILDEDGREYIDFGSGIAVNGLGAGSEGWQRAVIAQVMRLAHASNLYYTRPQTELAQLLCERTGMKKVFFANSGAEANECAIKTARKYGTDHYGPQRCEIITLKNSFHGRTIATLAATGQDKFHENFGPFPAGFRYAEPDDYEGLAALVDDKVCAVMIELIQGEGGVRVLDRDFVKKVAALCAEKDLLLIVDEVQTGNGRTGKLYCYMNYGIQPDLFTTAKGLGGGLPIGAAVFGEKCCDTLQKGDHGSTFGGNPVCAAGAVYVMEQITDSLMDSVVEKGGYLMNALLRSPGVRDVSGMGLMIGIDSVKPAAEVAKACLADGLLVLTAHDRVRLLPALNIPMAQLEAGLAILRNNLKP